MSQVYSTEPQTTGRVILNTSHGPIDIHLWCKECPTTTRAFLQLCLDGFYDDMVFHRILDNFLIQTGKMKCNSNDSSIVDMDEHDDMNGADGGNAEKYWESTVLLNTSNDKAEFMTRKKLELNPRIRFNHRGQIAMALPLDYEMPSSSSKETDKEITSLARQFFITMDEAPYLQSKYVIFGTVTGDTIFNALRINRTNEGAQSTGGNSNNNDNSGNEGQVPDLQNAPKIQSIRIISHLFHDLNMTKGTLIPWNSMNKLGAGFIGLKKGQVSDVKKRRKKRKGKKDLNVLSFGAEMEDGDDFGMQSSHDVLLSHNSNNSNSNNGNKNGKLDDHDNNSSMTRPQITQTSQQQQQQQLKTNEMKHSPKIDTGHEHNDSTNNSTNDTDIDTHHKGDEAVTIKSSSHESSSSHKQKSTSTSISDSNINNRNSNNNNKKPKLSAIEARKLKYLTKSTTRTGIAKETYYKQSKQRDEKTMNTLLEFKSKMFQIKQRSDTTSSTAAAVGEVDNSLASRMARREQQQQQQQTKSNQSSSVPVYSGQILDDDDDDDGHDQLLQEKSWLKHRFKCKRHVDHESKDLALGGDGRNAMEEYEVIDYQKGGREREHGREHGGGRSHDSLNNSRSGKRQHPKGSRSNYSRKHY